MGFNRPHGFVVTTCQVPLMDATANFNHFKKVDHALNTCIIRNLPSKSARKACKPFTHRSPQNLGGPFLG